MNASFYLFSSLLPITDCPCDLELRHLHVDPGKCGPWPGGASVVEESYGPNSTHCTGWETEFPNGQLAVQDHSVIQTALSQVCRPHSPKKSQGWSRVLAGWSIWGGDRTVTWKDGATLEQAHTMGAAPYWSLLWPLTLSCQRSVRALEGCPPGGERGQVHLSLLAVAGQQP